MRIAHVITGLGVGGAERVLLDLCGEMVERGHRVAIWAVANDLGALERGSDPRVIVYSLGVNKNPLTWVRGAFRLVAGLRLFRADVVHAHLFHALLILFLARVFERRRAPLIFTSHSFLVRGQTREWFLRATAGLRSADVTFGAGQHPHLNCMRVAMIANGIPVARDDRHRSVASRDPGPWRFINVGRFEEPKGHRHLVAEFSRLIAKGVDAELWLVGDGPLRPMIENDVSRLELGSRVKLWGRRTDIQHLLSQADAFVLSSEWEGLPIVLLEAGAVELPVISTRVGSVPDLLSGGYGLLVERSQLAEAMFTVVANYDEAIAMGRRLGCRVRDEYSSRKMAEAHLRLYAELRKGDLP